MWRKSDSLVGQMIHLLSLKEPCVALEHAPALIETPGVALAVGLSRLRLSVPSLEGRQAGTLQLIRV